MGLFLVTGAAGFIGSNVCRTLLAEGGQVVGIDNLNSYYDLRLKDYRLDQLLGNEQWNAPPERRASRYDACGRIGSGRFTFQRIDIENTHELEKIFSDYSFDAVFHLAARAGVRASMEEPHVYVTTNILGTLNLLQCLKQCQSKKMIMASTSSLYAGSRPPFSETSPVNTPLSPYAATKKAAEVLGYTYHKTFGIDFVALRYFTVYGPAARPDMSPFRFVQWIDQGRPVKIFGDGRQTRDFTYVDDVAEATVSAGSLSGFHVINIGAGMRPVSINELVRRIECELGKNAEKVFLPFNPADMSDTAADITKANEVLGWRPKTGIVNGIRETVAWYREHRDWVADIECK